MKELDRIVSLIQQFPQFEGLPAEQIRTYVELSEILSYEPDEVFIKKGDEINGMYLLLSGQVKLDMRSSNKTILLDTFTPGDLTGKLPFSRLQTSIAYLTATEESQVLYTPMEVYPELAHHYELIETFVHALSDRVRHFTTEQQQNEKLMALGKLSAGLAHELNNPASAIVRSAVALKKNLHAKPKKFKRILELELSSSQIDAINALIFEKLQAEQEELDLMARSEQEDLLANWMEDQGLDDGYELAETFVEFGIIEADLQKMLDIGTSKALDPILNWVEDVLITEKMIEEVEDASRRISELVSSVKTYSHMDQANEKEPVKVKKLIKSTLNILNHKIRNKQIQVDLSISKDLPTFTGYVSELNQVWMNLLDNAIDAVDMSGSIEITAKATNEDYRIYFKDNGGGIPDDIISNIFDPFFTTKGIGEGTGLGLDLSRKIIEKHGGSISVESKPGETVFELCFPLFKNGSES